MSSFQPADSVQLSTDVDTGRLTVEDVARRIEVDPKTVQRWINGRIPHRRHRWALVSLTNEAEEYLWPPLDSPANTDVCCTDEIVAAFAHRADASPSLWWELLVKARSNIDLLGYAMLHLPEQHSNLMGLMRQKAGEDCSIRITLVDPQSEEAHRRDHEEGLGGGLVARIGTSAKYFGEGLNGCAGVEIRQHATPMYNSIFRFDNEMVVTPHLFSIPGSKAPLLHLRRRKPGGLFDNFQQHFDGIWKSATLLKGIA